MAYRRVADFGSISQWPFSILKTYIICENRTLDTDFTKSAHLFRNRIIYNLCNKTNVYHIYIQKNAIIIWLYNPYEYYIFKNIYKQIVIPQKHDISIYTHTCIKYSKHVTKSSRYTSRSDAIIRFCASIMQHEKK